MTDLRLMVPLNLPPVSSIRIEKAPLDLSLGEEWKALVYDFSSPRSCSRYSPTFRKVKICFG